MKLHEFTTTGIKNTNAEFKLYTIEHNLKRIYNEINRKKTTKNKKNYKKNQKHKIQLKILRHIPKFYKNILDYKYFLLITL